MTDSVDVALTCDDAPTLSARQHVPAEPRRMDRLREALVDAGVSHCVAFVVSANADGAKAQLERWLDAGYELGNHTRTHSAASATPVAETIASIRSCDQMLCELGAFDDGRPKWFRFPYLDRGQCREDRATIQQACSDLGYRVAHASVDLFDHCYEEPLGRTQEPWEQRRISRRYVDTALRNLRRAAAQSDGTALVPYFHFGPSSALNLAEILQGAASMKARWVPLDQAMSQPLYRSFDQDFERNGLVAFGARSLRRRLAGRALRLGRRWNLLEERELGPKWPEI